MRLSEKYVAGLLDSDGHVTVRSRVGAKPDLSIGIGQDVMYNDVLEAIADDFGGYVHVQKSNPKAASWNARGRIARNAAMRLMKYLVCKRDVTAMLLDLVDDAPVLSSEEDVELFRGQVRSIRQNVNKTTANYPSRRWLAGYFDGDGSFAVKVCNKTGYAYPFATILSEPKYACGIELIEKAFGGRMHKSGTNIVWSLSLSQPSKIKQFLPHFAKYLVRKQAQAYFLLGCAENGNLRDGEAIRSAIKALNARQHRLSDPAGHAAELVRGVRFDIEKRRVGRPPGVKETRPRNRTAAAL